MPVQGSPLLEFCIPALSSKKYINFKWINEKQRILVLECLSKKNKKRTKAYDAVYLDYVKFCKRKGIESSNPKRRFIAALDNSKFLIKTGSKSHRLYKIKEKCYKDYLSKASPCSISDYSDVDSDELQDSEFVENNLYVNVLPTASIGLLCDSSECLTSPDSIEVDEEAGLEEQPNLLDDGSFEKDIMPFDGDPCVVQKPVDGFDVSRIPWNKMELEDLKNIYGVSGDDTFCDNNDVIMANDDVNHDKPDVIPDNPDVITDNPDVIPVNPDVICVNPDVILDNPNVICVNTDVIFANGDEVVAGDDNMCAEEDGTAHINGNVSLVEEEERNIRCEQIEGTPTSSMNYGAVLLPLATINLLDNIRFIIQVKRN